MTRACITFSLVQVGLLGVAASQTPIHSIHFQTYPSRGVNVTVGADPQQAIDGRIDLAFPNDPVKVKLSCPGFKTKTIEVAAQDAASAAASFTGDYPGSDHAPIVLDADNSWIAFLTSVREHPMGDVLVLAGLSLAFPLSFRAWRTSQQQRAFRQRFSEYEAKRDPMDSVLMMTVDGYILVQPLGKGGMATVYKGLPADTLDESGAVAVKILSRDLFDDVDFQRRFLREVQAYQKLQHPNIVRLYSWRQPDNSNQDSPFIILELIRGGTLSKSIPCDGLAWPEAAPLLEQIFSAIQFAHEKGMVHRDLKPDNIMLDEGRIKIMDFGLSRDVNASLLTATGSVMGTPSFMAPEQLAEGSSKPEVDQYSLGVICYHIFTGRLPHEAEDVMQLFSKLLTAPPIPPSQYKPDLSPRVERVVLRMLAREPQARFKSVLEAWEALKNASEGKS